MANTIPASTLEKFTTFGDLLRFLRRRAGITQLEFSIQVGYSDSQISRLEQNMRLPDPPTIEARFVPALCLEEEPRAVARLLELAATVRREDAPVLGMCPYKGLDYFDEADADLFVGREALTEKLVDRILSLASKTHPEQTRFFTIVGASGSGKSSLVRAGLIPALRWNKASAHWPMVILTPTAHPLESLAEALTHEHGSYAAVGKLMDDLAADHRSLQLYVNRQLKGIPASHLLILIDQFEELFSLCRSEEERRAFIDNLLTAASNRPGGVLVIITLRADFYAHCASFSSLRDLLAAHQEYIGAMSDAEMRRAIEEPARRGRWEFEDGLVDLMLRDVGHEPGALPLLSHALLETWHRRHGRTLTLSGYISAGGVHGAIAETAEAVFTDQFTQAQQLIARRIFIRLTELGDQTSTGDTRRRASLTELILNPEEADLTHAVIKALSDARLITTSEDSVQVAHEALIREWPTLRFWLEENREGLRLHRHLTIAAQEWFASDRESGMLLRGARLAQAREWVSAHPDELNPQEQVFLLASITFSEREAAERQAQQQRELEAVRKLAVTERQRAEEGVKSARRLRLRTILITIVSVIAVILAAFTIYTWQGSASQVALNQSRRLAAFAQKADQSGQGDLALALALEAIKLDSPPIEAVSALREIAQSSGTRVVIPVGNYAPDLVAISPNSLLGLTSGCAQQDSSGACEKGELTIYDLATHEELQRWIAHTAAITAIAFTQSGRLIVSGAQDGSLTLWDTQGKQVRQLVGHTSRITGIAVFINSSLILSASSDGSRYLWETQSGQVLQSYFLTFPITALTNTPGMLTAATALQDGSLMVWSLYKAYPEDYFENLGENIDSIAISPDASWVMFISNEKSGTYLRRIDTQSGKLLNQEQFTCSPASLALNPEATFALISCQSAIYQLDIERWTVEQIFVESPGIINDITISADGRFALWVSQNGTLSVWSLQSDLEFSVENIGANLLEAAAISPHGTYLFLNDVSKEPFSQPGVFDLTKHETTAHYFYFNRAAGPSRTAISTDELFVAMSGMVVDPVTPTLSVPNVLIWDMKSRLFRCRITDIDAPVSSIAFNPANHNLAVGSQDIVTKSGELTLWNIQTCELERKFETSTAISNVAFNRTGTSLLTALPGSSGVALWDVETGTEIKRFSTLQSEPIVSAVFGPDGTTVFGTGLGALYLWDVDTGEIIRSYSAQFASISSASLSPDGKFVLASTLNGDLLLWDFTTGEELRRLNTGLDISTVLFSPDSKTAYAIAREGQLVTWHIAEKSLAELLDWVRSNRYIRDLTCAERLQYHVDPQCKP